MLDLLHSNTLSIPPSPREEDYCCWWRPFLRAQRKVSGGEARVLCMDGKLLLQGIKRYCWKNNICGVSYLERSWHTQHQQCSLKISNAAWKTEPFLFCGSFCTSTMSWATLNIFYMVFNFIGMSQDTVTTQTHRACWWIGCSFPLPGEWLGRNPAQRGITGRAAECRVKRKKKIK